MIDRYTKPYIEEEGSADENDLEEAIDSIELEPKSKLYILKYVSIFTFIRTKT